MPFINQHVNERDSANFSWTHAPRVRGWKIRTHKSAPTLFAVYTPIAQRSLSIATRADRHYSYLSQQWWSYNLPHVV